MHGSGAAIGKQYEIARIMAVRNRDLLDGGDHAGDGDAHDTVGKAHRLEADTPAKSLERLERKGPIKWDMPRAERRAGRQAIEREVGVSDRYLLTATAIAGRARCGSGALRSDHQGVAGIDPGDGATTGTDRIDLDLRRAIGVVGDLLLAGDRHLQRLDQADIGRRATHVAGDDVGNAELAPRCTAAATPAAGPERTVEIGRRRARAAVATPPAEVMMCRSRAEASITQAVLEPREVAVHQWANVGIERGRIETLVLAKLRQNLARRAHELAWTDRGDDGLGRQLMLGIGIAVQETDGDGDVAPFWNACGEFLDLGRIDGSQGRTIEEETLVDLDGARAGYEGRRLLRTDVIEDRPVRPPDLEHVPKALRHQHPDLGALAFEHGVGADRDAMHQPLDRAQVQLHGREDLENGAGRVGGGRRCLGESECACGLDHRQQRQ